MAISQAAFTTNDTLVKIATETVGTGQIMLVRGLFATLLMGLLVWRLGDLQPLNALRHPAIMVRIVGEIGGTVFFLIALAHLPLANLSAMLQALPLAIAMSAALFFGEQVGPRRWTAIAAGFIGVMIIVRPGLEGFSAYSLLALASVACCTFRDLATRRIPQTVPSTFVSLVTAASVTICGGLLLPVTGGWVAMGSRELTLLIGAAVLVLVGYHTLIQSIRTGDISFVAQFRYVALLWAIAAGYLVFGSVPDPYMILGAAIVIASGVYMLYRERVVGRSRPVAETSGPGMAADGL